MNEIQTLAYKVILNCILDKASSYEDACSGIDALADDYRKIAKLFFDSLNKIKQ